MEEVDRMTRLAVMALCVGALCGACSQEAPSGADSGSMDIGGADVDLLHVRDPFVPPVINICPYFACLASSESPKRVEPVPAIIVTSLM